MRYLLIILFLIVSSTVCGHIAGAASAPPAESPAGSLAQWLVGLQYTDASLPSFGALRVHPTFAAVGVDGRPYCRVSPYIGNLAVLGLLRSGRPEALLIAERWITWFLAHLNAKSAPDGVPFEHFYLEDGSGETVCVKPGDPHLCRYNDATDSAAATFFSVLRAYQEAHGRSDAFFSAGRREKIESMASALLALRNPDGLFWAKRDYRAKYLEDNCEVYAGLDALAHVTGFVFKDRKRAAQYAEAAELLRKAILKEFYDPAHSRYYTAIFEDNSRKAADLNIWYPDLQAQSWPHLFGVVAHSDAKSQAALAALNGLWDGKAHPDWAAEPDRINGGWVSADVAYAALLAGERHRIPVYLAAVERLKMHPPNRFSWPFTAADAGWLLLILAEKQAQFNHATHQADVRRSLR